MFWSSAAKVDDFDVDVQAMKNAHQHDDLHNQHPPQYSSAVGWLNARRQAKRESGWHIPLRFGGIGLLLLALVMYSAVVTVNTGHMREVNLVEADVANNNGDDISYNDDFKLVIEETESCDPDDPCDCVRDMTPEEICNVPEDEECDTGGRINYLKFYYCNHEFYWASLLLFFVELIILFYMLGTCAEDFFCPTLAVISDALRLSPDVAGITILALGNGAPDVFSTIAAVLDKKPDIALAELSGAGVFVTSVVTAAVTLASLATVEPLPLIRDVCFYLVAAAAMLVILFSNNVYLLEAIAMLLGYCVYVGISIASNIYANRAADDAAPPGNVNETSSLVERGSTSRRASVDHEDAYSSIGRLAGMAERAKQPEQSESPKLGVIDQLKGLGQGLVDDVDWEGKSTREKIMAVIVSPITIMFSCTVPQVDEENYNRLYNILFPLCTPFLIMTAFELWDLESLAWYYVLLIFEVVGLILSIAIFFTTTNDKLPRYNMVFVAVAFFTAVLWIFLIADELVSLLQTIGLILHLSEAFLGATILAWGNSIGDLIADVVVAKQGFPAMGIAACFGGPMFNMLIGLGLSFTISIATDPDSGWNGPYPVQLNTGIFMSYAFLMLSLITILVVVPISKFTFKRPLAMYNIVMYCCFTVINVLIAFGLINLDAYL